MKSSTQTTIGVSLIILIFAGWLYMMSEQQAKIAKNQPKPVAADTTRSTAPTDTSQVTHETEASHGATASQKSDTASGIFASAAAVPEVFKTVETPLFTATISSHGGAISSFVLKHYLTWDKKPLDLVDPTEHQGADINLRFVTSDGKLAQTNNFPFILDPKPNVLAEGDSITFSAFYRLDSGRSIEKVFHFSGKNYLVGIEYKLNGLENSVSGYHYTAALDNPLPFVEQRSQDDLTNAKVFAGIAGEIEDLAVSKAKQSESKSVNGDITYAGMRNQYFEKAMMPVGMKSIGALLTAKADTVAGGAIVAKYMASINVPIGRTSKEDLAFNLYFGPLEYDRISALGVGLDQSMYFGWPVVRPIAVHLLMPFFLWLHGFITNWGLVIIVFSIVIKLVTIPLSTGQMRSMRKMQVLAPMVTEVRDKYKDDQKKMNEEMMKLYRTYGVNPAGGCLPMVLQMPILFALYQVLKNVIQLRQAPFALWITDLSTPDFVIHLGKNIPLLPDAISGLTLFLVATMFLQQFFMVTDPRQKMMAYIMPFMFLFMFNNLPSGVALYYFMFNIFGLAQQFYLTKIATPLNIEDMKKDPKKGGGIMARLQDMEKQQRSTRQQQYTGKGQTGKKKK
ncbi:MAG: membrane protein insertase YidC [Bacteroidota bacterium]|nr:membrane protein insertase YidC [Bacteroidota bacterium]MDP4232020.1 membrane protein insertase YidC [Bacteroidota bacterium]MDP4241273.1 membrane protein insertase YidC [Bacteroidota bacterium]MDP4286665.1 membrane protein insertase YidC [Bacteroidota bacterium]